MSGQAASCMASTGGFQLDQLEKSQIGIWWNPASLHVLYALWLLDLYFW